VVTAYRQIRRRGLDGEEADELISQLLQDVGLTEVEQMTATLLLSEACGIQIWRPPGERRWTYYEGRHRARALMDAGVRRQSSRLMMNAVFEVNQNGWSPVPFACKCRSNARLYIRWRQPKE